MAINLGSAYVDIVPSTQGLAPKIRQQVDKPLEDAGRSGAKKFAEQFSSGVGGFAKAVTAPLASAMSSAMSSAGQAAMRALETTAAAGGAFLATSLVSGYNRLTTIQDATAALTISLGDATAAAAVLDDVLGVVRGTPFNLDQFAAAAQRLVGFGIEAEKIPSYLTAIGEASATQGKQANEFADRLATVFGQVAASGQVSLADVWRISDAGVNALAILANHFGVTRDAMKDMISAGAVPAGEALDALAKGILEGSDGPAGATVALAGTMEKLRDTLTGAAGGFRAATARLGEAILSPFTDVLTRAFTAMGGLLDEISGEIGEWAKGFVRSGAVDRVVEWLDQLPTMFERIKETARDLGPALAPIGAAIAALGLSGLSSALGPFGAIIPTINPVVGAFAAWVVTNDELRESFGNLGSALWDAFGDIADAAAPAAEALGSLFSDALISTVDWLAETAIPAISRFVSEALEALSGWWDEHGDNVKNGLAEFGRVWGEQIFPALLAVGGAIVEHVLGPLGELVTILVDNEGTWTTAAYGVAALGGALLITALMAHPVLALVAAIGLLIGVTDSLAKKYNDELVGAVQWVVDRFADFLDIVDRLIAAFKTAWEWATKVVEASAKIPVIGGGGGGLLPFLGPFDPTRGVPFVPFLNDGGIMPGPRGQHSLAWVAGGETILPTHTMDVDSALAAVGVGGSSPLIGGDLVVQQLPGEDAGTATYRALRRLSALRG